MILTLCKRYIDYFGFQPLTVSGNWTNKGTLTAGSSNVIFNGLNQLIDGSSITNFTPEYQQPSFATTIAGNVGNILAWGTELLKIWQVMIQLQGLRIIGGVQVVI